MNFNTNGDKKGNSLGCIFDNPEDPDQLSP